MRSQISFANRWWFRTIRDTRKCGDSTTRVNHQLNSETPELQATIFARSKRGTSRPATAALSSALSTRVSTSITKTCTTTSGSIRVKSPATASTTTETDSSTTLTAGTSRITTQPSSITPKLLFHLLKVTPATSTLMART